MSPLLKNILIALGATIFIGGGYFYFTNGQPETEVAVSGSQEATLKSAETLANTKKITKFNLSGDILRDDRFIALKKSEIDLKLNEDDFSRSNPFEPVH